MNELLLELFSEEIPAKMQNTMSLALRDMIALKLKTSDIYFDYINHYATPRRITIFIKNITFQLTDITEEKRGPKIEAPSLAIEAFAKSCNILKENLFIKDGYYFGNILKKTQNITKNIKTIINQVIASVNWPKSMKWGSYDIKWIRPLINILCLYNKEILPVSFGHLIANNKSFGHRFLGKEFTIIDFDDYQKKLNDNFVVLDGNIRKKIILDQAATICDSLNIQLKQDDDLLEEVIGLVEYPVLLAIKIDQEFMDLPEEILVTAIKTHQKYFVTYNQGQSLAPYCLVVSNIKTIDGGEKIIQGNERVLRARLFDAKFFYQQDLQFTLDKMNEKLINVIYHQKIGSMADKISHMLELLDILGGDRDLLKRAITLCKNDLASQVVGEFPELQGVMGYYYAKNAKEHELVCLAICDHYKPIGKNDRLPDNIGALVAIADKITSIACMFFIGEKPTSSKDPLAIRRAAIGIIRIIIEHKLTINLRDLVGRALLRFSSDKKIIDEIMLFFLDRFKNILKDQNIHHNVVASILNCDGINNLSNIADKIYVLNKFIQTDQGRSLIEIHKRANNIVKKKDSNILDNIININEQFFIESIEHILFSKIRQISPMVRDSVNLKDYHQALIHLTELIIPVSEFFDTILVNIEDVNIRTNRLNLLVSIVKIMEEIADFAMIEG